MTYSLRNHRSDRKCSEVMTSSLRILAYLTYHAYSEFIIYPYSSSYAAEAHNKATLDQLAGQMVQGIKVYHPPLLHPKLSETFYVSKIQKSQKIDPCPIMSENFHDIYLPNVRKISEFRNFVKSSKSTFTVQSVIKIF